MDLQARVPDFEAVVDVLAGHLRRAKQGRLSHTKACARQNTYLLRRVRKKIATVWGLNGIVRLSTGGSETLEAFSLSILTSKKTIIERRNSAP